MNRIEIISMVIILMSLLVLSVGISSTIMYVIGYKKGFKQYKDIDDEIISNIGKDHKTR